MRIFSKKIEIKSVRYGIISPRCLRSEKYNKNGQYVQPETRLRN